MRLTHSCARNADLTSSGHAVWPNLLHRPLIRSVTTSLILLQTSLITSFWWEFMLIFRPWTTILFMEDFDQIQLSNQLAHWWSRPELNRRTRSFNPLLYRLSYRTTIPCLFMPLLWFSQGVPPYYIGQGIVNIILKRVGFEPCISSGPVAAGAFTIKLSLHINGRFCYAPAKALTIYQPCGKTTGLMQSIHKPLLMDFINL